MKIVRPLATLAATAVVGVALAVPAGAAVRYYTVDVNLTWSARTCVDLMEPSSVDRTRLIYTQACRVNGMASTSYVVSSGDYFGVDPIMGDNEYLHCSAALNGVNVYNSWATAGNGVQVSCLGIAP